MYYLKQYVSVAAIFLAALSIQTVAQSRPPMPDFDFEQVIRGGRPVVVNFWATYCKPCIQEMPDLARLQKRWGRRVLILGINVERPSEEQKVKNFVQRSVINYPVIFNSRDVFDQYGGQSIPLTLIFNGKGKVIARQAGSRADFGDWISSQVTPLLNKKTSNAVTTREQQRWRRREP